MKAFYNLGPLKKLWFYKHQSRFALVFLDSFLGPPSLAWHTWGYLCESLVPEATHELRLNALEGRRVSSKSHTRESETQMRELID